MGTLNNMTYEALLERARNQSIGGWAAIVEIHRYLSGESFTTIAVSSAGPIKSHSRGGEFRGVGVQFRDGRPFGRSTPKSVAVDLVTTDSDDDELPF